MERKEYVNEADLPHILGAIFDDRVVIYEAYSAFEQELLSFSDLASLESYISHAREQNSFINLKLHYPDAGGNAFIERIALIPEKCNGATYRYVAHGWGLIQLQMEFSGSPTIHVRFAVNTSTRAHNWAPLYPDLAPPEAWNWKLVEKHVRRLIRVLRKHALAQKTDPEPV